MNDKSVNSERLFASINRRSFLKTASLTAVVGVLGLTGCDSGAMGGGELTAADGVSVDGNTVIVDLTKQTELASAGGFLLISSVDGKSVRAVIVNLDGTNFKSYTSICTHQACDVSNYNTGSKRMLCLCHGAQFDAATGNAVAGPAPRGLTPYKIAHEGNLLTVNLA